MFGKTGTGVGRLVVGTAQRKYTVVKVETESQHLAVGDRLRNWALIANRRDWQFAKHIAILAVRTSESTFYSNSCGFDQSLPVEIGARQVHSGPREIGATQPIPTPCLCALL